MKITKKAAIELEKLVAAIIILVVLVVLIYVFTTQFGKGATTTGNKIDCLKEDTDTDGVPDALDRCCVTYRDNVGIDGCAPDQQKETCTNKCGTGQQK